MSLKPLSGESLCNVYFVEVSFELASILSFIKALGEDKKVYKIQELPKSQDSNDSNPTQQSTPLIDDEITRGRRSIYQNNLYSLHVGFNGRKAARSRYKQLLPQNFSNDPVLESRARMWL
ncbi:putative beta-glucosidase I [Fusarium oxysporum f. sp. albedinis]|nr:putative beta-glucosidase I [Fusarium oxysporum f. sp. albedinis]